jgi:hypothetical protein
VVFLTFNSGVFKIHFAALIKPDFEWINMNISEKIPKNDLLYLFLKLLPELRKLSKWYSSFISFVPDEFF